jgi:hypothetical protein
MLAAEKKVTLWAMAMSGNWETRSNQVTEICALGSDLGKTENSAN